MNRKLRLAIIWIIGIIIFIILFKFIFFPAYISTIASCSPETFEKYSDDYYIAGQVSFEPMDNGETNITIELVDQDIPTLKHEQCHVKQFERGMLASCKVPYFVFINEVECYTIQRLYEIFY